MNIEEFRDYCLHKKGTEETFPFGTETLVYKVGGKMYALTSLNSPEFSINLKCDPGRATELRETYEAVRPGYHMNKVHWNTVYPESLPASLIAEWIDHSYDLVVSGLPKKIKTELNHP